MKKQTSILSFKEVKNRHKDDVISSIGLTFGEADDLIRHEIVEIADDGLFPALSVDEKMDACEKARYILAIIKFLEDKGYSGRKVYLATFSDDEPEAIDYFLQDYLDIPDRKKVRYDESIRRLQLVEEELDLVHPINADPIKLSAKEREPYYRMLKLVNRISSRIEYILNLY